MTGVQISSNLLSLSVFIINSTPIPLISPMENPMIGFVLFIYTNMDKSTILYGSVLDQMMLIYCSEPAIKPENSRVFTVGS